MQQNDNNTLGTAAQATPQAAARHRGKPLLPNRLLAVCLALAIALGGTLLNSSSAQANELLIKKEVPFTFTYDHPDQPDNRALRWYKIGDYWQAPGKKPTYNIRANKDNRKVLFPVFEKVLGKRYNQYGVDNLITVMADGVLDQSPDRPWSTGTTRKLADELAKVTDQMKATGKDRPLRFSSKGSSNEGSNDGGSTNGSLSGTLLYPAGMYLVIDIAEPTLERTRSIPMIVASGTMADGRLTDPYAEATVALKNTHNTRNTIAATHRTASIGSTVTYTMYGTVANPKPTFFRFEGKPGYGLTIDPASFSAQADGVPIPFAENFTVDLHALHNGTDGNDDAIFTVAMREEKIAEHAGKNIAVSHNARINSDAIGRTYAANRVRRNVDAAWQEFSVWSLKILAIQFAKTDADDKGVQGARFTLSVEDGQTGVLPSGDGTTTQATSSSRGLVTFTGLQAGTYTCTETKVANGYLNITAKFTIELSENGLEGETQLKSRPLTDPFGLVDENDGTVLNVRSVAQLPLSGAVGTTMFVVAGLILAGVGVAVARRGRRAASRASR